MRFTLSFIIAAAMLPSAAHAQFGWSVTFDPTQAGHAIQQIAQAEKTYTTTVQTAENVINAYNLAKRMASSPSSLYTSYGSGLPSWVPVLPSNDTYGNTGSWVLNALADFIPDSERIVVIEDTSELRIAKPNVVAAECQGESTGFEPLLKASLRWRPDRIILGEVRGEEARTLLDSFNTGHAGSMATIHAISAVRALRRFTELAMRSHQQAVREDIAQEIAESVQVVVHVQHFAESRRLSEVIEVRGYDRTSKTFLYDTIYDVNHTTNTLHHVTGETPHAHA